MKIQGPRPIGTTGVRRPGRSREVPKGGFSIPGAAPARPSATEAAAGVDALDGLLAIQESANEGGGERRRARARGEAILDQLDRVRDGLLSGRIDGHTIVRLVEALRGRRAAIADPRIAEVLDEIELRAMVELTKLEATGAIAGR